MTRLLLSFSVTALALAGAACSPPPPAPIPAPPPSTAVTDSLKATFAIAKDDLTKTAEQVPEAKYAYQPTKEVRTMGQILAHVADSNYMFCGVASGEKGPAESAEQTKKKKADIQQALADSFEFCDRAFAGLNDQTGGAEVTLADIGNMKSTKLGVLSFNTAHDMEHYGNLVTYMRLNKMVPPSSQPPAPK
jgi:uncharacterized damage-inducible protein DinB